MILSNFSEGVNAILPNLDLVFVASRLCELEGINPGFHKVHAIACRDYHLSYSWIIQISIAALY